MSNHDPDWAYRLELANAEAAVMERLARAYAAATEARARYQAGDAAGQATGTPRLRVIRGRDGAG